MPLIFQKKSSEAGYNALIRILDEHIEAYEIFIKYCQDNDLETNNFPDPAGISLEKMSAAAAAYINRNKKK